MSDQYPPMPTDVSSGPADRGPLPAPVALARKLMSLRAAFGLLSVVLTFQRYLRDTIRK